MKEKRILISLLIFFISVTGSIFLSRELKAYGSKFTHPGLTKEVAKLYNTIYEPDLTNEEIQSLMRGSTDEDTPPRWINHFYDPTTNKGWLGKRLRGVPEEKVREIAKIVFGKEAVSALNWVNNQQLQAESYSRYQGNRAFEKAVSLFLEGKKKEAYYTLGYVLHLIEDMAVPAHTRQDTHFDIPVPELFEKLTNQKFDKGEPYENWAEDLNRKNSDLNLTVNLKNNYQTICKSLDECLISLAKYSNENFFSEDTIFDKEYELPKPPYFIDEKDIQKINVIIRTYFSKDNYPLARAKVQLGRQTTKDISLNFPEIHQIYWERLTAQGIITGTEVLRYFHEQVEKAKNKEITIKKEPKVSFWNKIKNISLYGEVIKIYKFAQNTLSKLNIFQAAVAPTSFESKKENLEIKTLPEVGPRAVENEEILKKGETEEELKKKELQEIIDDLLERIDLIQAEIARLTREKEIQKAAEKEKIKENPEELNEEIEEEEIKEEEIEEETKEQEDGICIVNINTASEKELQKITGVGPVIAQRIIETRPFYSLFDLIKVSGIGEITLQKIIEQGCAYVDGFYSSYAASGGGGSPPPEAASYPEILISEIQILPIGQRFIELYNPNDYEINLTGWYIQRKTQTSTAWNSFVSSTKFEGKSIQPKSHFLIARSSILNPDILLEDLTLTENNALILKNPNREIVDKIGWGDAQEFETTPSENPLTNYSIGRKWIEETDEYQDSDNNSNDFEIQVPTPKTKNERDLTPPETEIISHPPNLTNQVQATFTFSSNEENSTFECKIDNNNWESCQAPKNYSNLSDGEHNFSVRAKDPLSNIDPTPAQYAWTIDSTIKGASLSLADLDSDSLFYTNELTVEAIISNDEEAAAWLLSETQREKPDANDPAWQTKKPLIFTLSQEDGNKTVYIWTKDEVDNISPLGNSASIILDTTPPTAEAGSGQTVEINQPVTLDASSSSDNRGIAFYKWDINNDGQWDLEDKIVVLENGYSIIGNYTINLEVTDAAGNKATDILMITVNLPEEKDITPPQIFFTLGSIQTSLSFPVIFEITDATSTVDYATSTVDLVPPSGLDGFFFHWKEDSGDWQETEYQEIEDKPTTFAGVIEFTGEDEKTYYFQAKAKDVAGNESEWLPMEPVFTKISLSKKILISEVQIAGDRTSYDFIELYNPNNFDIYLENYSLIKRAKTSTSDTTIKSWSTSPGAVIPARGYYLWASSTDENYPSLVGADVATQQNISKNNGIALKYKEDDVAEIIDAVGWGNFNNVLFEENSFSENPTKNQSLGRIWNFETQEYQDTDNNSADFRIQEPSPKSAPLLITIKDATDYLTCIGGNLSGTYYNLLIKWQSPNPDLDFYQVQYKKNDSDWQELFSQTQTTEIQTREIEPRPFFTPYSLLNDNIYFFRTRAYDKKGNPSDWAEIKIDLTIPVVINEVALWGTNATSTPFIVDQWLELYNRSGEDIDLTGWKLVSGCSGATLNFELTGTISARDTFLLEKGDDSVISDVPANQIFTGSLEKCYLKLLDKNNKYIDQFYSPSGGWSKKDFIKENKYFSMERISPYSLGSDSENWKLNNEEIISGRDRSGNEIYGTPAQQNSNYQLYTSYSSDFIENTTLKKYLSPYYFHDQINISEDVTLAVEPGVIIKFYNSNNFGGLTIQGILKAIGSEEEPIIFDSFRESIPWLGLYFTEKSANSELENIVVRRGGNKWGSYSGAGIKIKDTSVSLKNSILEDNYNQGLWLINSSSTIDNIEFLRHNRASSGNKGKAVYIDGGTPIIKNSTLKNNYYGIYIRNSEPVLENLIFGEDEEKNTCEIYKNGKCHK